METINYTPVMDGMLRNVGNLPTGLRCKYLLCIYGPSTDDSRREDMVLVAKRWCREMPKSGGDVVVIFGR